LRQVHRPLQGPVLTGAAVAAVDHHRNVERLLLEEKPLTRLRHERQLAHLAGNPVGEFHRLGCRVHEVEPALFVPEDRMDVTEGVDGLKPGGDGDVVFGRHPPEYHGWSRHGPQA
jgi:hypothetical protein